MARHGFLQQLGLFTLPNFLTPEECIEWRGLAAASPGVEAHVYRDDQNLLDEEQRKTLEIAVKDSLQIATERRLRALQADIAGHYDVELDDLASVHCLLYRPGDFFRLHVDRPQPDDIIEDPVKYQELLRRSVTVVVFLNEPGDAAEPYEGGELSLYGLLGTAESAKFGFSVDAEAGLLIAFRASTFHEVSPVLLGKRYTLVTWFLTKEPLENSHDHHHDVEAEAP